MSLPNISPITKAGLYIICSEFCFATMGASVKAVSLTLPQETIIFFRNIFALLVLLIFSRRKKHFLKDLSTRVFPWHALRTIAGLSAMYCFFFSIGEMPLGQAALLKMTSPLFIPLIMLCLFQERTGKTINIALSIGFIGVLLVLNPEGGIHWALFLGLLGGCLAGLAQVCVGRLAITEPTYRIVMYFTLLSTTISTIPLLWGWQSPNASEYSVLLIMGTMGAGGQLLMSRGFAMAKASSVASFTYFSVIFSSLYGYIFWNEELDWHFWIGSILIAAAGISVVNAIRCSRHSKT